MKLLESTQAFRLVLFLLYGLIVVALNAVILWRPDRHELPISVKANQALPANRLLRPEDLRADAGGRSWY